MELPADLGDGVSLAMRTLATVEPMHRLTLKNLDRLREWEPWAQPEQTIRGLAAFTEFQLAQHAQGFVVPALIVRDGDLIGSISLRIDRVLATAELGYWIDRDAEGMGIAFRACSALLDHARSIGTHWVEIRTAALNERSCRLAERLGFEREEVLRQALALGDRRLDVAVYRKLIAAS